MVVIDVEQYTRIPVQPCELARGDLVAFGARGERVMRVTSLGEAGGAPLVKGAGVLATPKRVRLNAGGLAYLACLVPITEVEHVAAQPRVVPNSRSEMVDALTPGRYLLDEAGDLAYRSVDGRWGAWLRVDGRWGTVPAFWSWASEPKTRIWTVLSTRRGLPNEDAPCACGT